ncbi:AMP-binding protein [Carboxydothermus pertinax]|uniref:AMP-binding protein n=1 Tax=Carboxydothermus pertinax TaxID=870242 RepID=UPI0009823403
MSCIFYRKGFSTRGKVGLYLNNTPDFVIGHLKSRGCSIAEILYTSGTTGKPKGVLLSHRTVYFAGMMYMYEMNIYYRDKVLILMPLIHSAPSHRSGEKRCV